MERFDHRENTTPDESRRRMQKRAVWNRWKIRVNEMADANGRGLDEGIKDTVIAFNVLKLNTEQSCEGHSFDEEREGHMPWPWITISAPEKPEQRFKDENKVFEKYANKHGLDVRRLKRGWPEDAYWNLRRELVKREETEEYKNWQQKNRALYTKLDSLLSEFYTNRQVNPLMQLSLSSDGAGIELASQDPRNIDVLEQQLTGKDKEELMNLLPQRQQEMKDFTEFLKKKYLKNETG